MKRPNVDVLSKAHATRIIFEGGRATGVEFSMNGKMLIAKAGREVILSGGAVNSPQLLQLSGIGDAKALQALGISILVNNPNVGRHLADHQGLNYTYRMKVPTLNDELRPWWGKLRHGLSYLLRGRGPLSISINHGGGFFRTNPDEKRPNMQLYMQAFSTLIPRTGERPILTPDPFSGMSLGLSNCRPTSRGEITIKSADPFEHPRITANAYSTDHDVKEMLEAVKFIRRIAAQKPMADLIAEELRPGPHVTSDQAMIADIRERSGTVYHPCSTCRMGPSEKTSVVSPTLKLHGVEGLRVIDASAFPSIISGNLNAAAMMIGWKGAELILADAT